MKGISRVCSTQIHSTVSNKFELVTGQEVGRVYVERNGRNGNVAIFNSRLLRHKKIGSFLCKGRSFVVELFGIGL